MMQVLGPSMATDQSMILRAPQDPPDEWDKVQMAAGYTWCRPCAEWHRPPECWIDEQGVSELDQPRDDA